LTIIFELSLMKAVHQIYY